MKQYEEITGCTVDKTEAMIVPTNKEEKPHAALLPKRIGEENRCKGMRI